MQLRVQAVGPCRAHTKPRGGAVNNDNNDTAQWEVVWTDNDVVLLLNITLDINLIKHKMPPDASLPIII